MTTTHRRPFDIDRLHDVAKPERMRVIPPSPQARQYLDTQHRAETLAAQQRAWEWRQRDRLMDRCPPSALAPVVRCRPVSVWVRLGLAIRNLF